MSTNTKFGGLACEIVLELHSNPMWDQQARDPECPGWVKTVNNSNRTPNNTKYVRFRASQNQENMLKNPILVGITHAPEYHCKTIAL